MPIIDHSMHGKVALITGGSKGIGRAIALAFAENGADIAIAARGLEALEATGGELRKLGRRVVAIPADVGRTEAVEDLYEQVVAEHPVIGKLDETTVLEFVVRALAPLVER